MKGVMTMALIICPECGKEISDKAKCCIHCGYPLEEEAQKQPELPEEDRYWEAEPDGFSSEKDAEGIAGPEPEEMSEAVFINCPVCGKQVSSKTYDCPNCGHPINEKEGISFGMVLLAVIAGILILSIF